MTTKRFSQKQNSYIPKTGDRFDGEKINNNKKLEKYWNFVIIIVSYDFTPIIS